jgi:hypothetical protein
MGGDRATRFGAAGRSPGAFGFPLEIGALQINFISETPGSTRQRKL